MSALQYMLKCFKEVTIWNFSPIDPKNNSHLYLDMTYPPTKFDVDWSLEIQVIVKKLKFDTRPPTNIPNLIARFHLVKTWLIVVTSN